MDKKLLKGLIEKERKAGVSVSLIRDKLIAKGYPKDIIDDVLDLKVPEYRVTNVKFLTIWVGIFAVFAVSFIFFYNLNLGTVPTKPIDVNIPVVVTNVPLTINSGFLSDQYIPGASACRGKKDSDFRQCIQDLALNANDATYCTIVKDPEFQKSCYLEYLKVKSKKNYCDAIFSMSFSKDPKNFDTSGFVTCSSDLAKSLTSVDGCGSNEICRANFYGMTYEDYCLSDKTDFVPKAKCFAYFKRVSTSFVIPKDYDLVTMDKQDLSAKPATCDMEGTSFRSNFAIDYDVYVGDILTKNCAKYTG